MQALMDVRVCVYCSLDNAYDPGVDAKRLEINVEDINGMKCLSFTDDGSGMTPMQLHKMLRLVQNPNIMLSRRGLGLGA